MLSKKEKLIAALIPNTKTKKRPLDLISINNKFKELIQEINSKKEVSKLLGISVGMINKFLSIERLNSYVINIVKCRKIDSVSVANQISKYKLSEQTILANAIINEELSGRDLKVFGPLRKAYPNKKISELIDILIDSKNRQISVGYIETTNKSLIEKPVKMLENKLGDEFISFDVKSNIAIIKVTKEGEKFLRKEAKTKKMTLRKYFNKLLFN